MSNITLVFSFRRSSRNLSMSSFIKKTLMDFFRTSSVIYFGNPYEKASKKSSNDTFRNKRFRIPQEFFLRKSFKVPLRNDSRYSFGNYLQYSSMDLSRDSFKKYSLNFFRNCYIAFNSYIFFLKRHEHV